MFVVGVLLLIVCVFWCAGLCWCLCVVVHMLVLLQYMFVVCWVLTVVVVLVCDVRCVRVVCFFLLCLICSDDDMHVFDGVYVDYAYCVTSCSCFIVLSLVWLFMRVSMFFSSVLLIICGVLLCVACT